MRVAKLMTNLALGFSEAGTAMERRRGGIAGSVERFEQWMAVPDSPIRAIRRQAAREGEYAEIPASVAPALHAALIARGIPRLYAHQAEAFERAVEGKNVAVVTPTASGKTLCYNLPVLDRMLRDRDARAMYLFPTKALAEDQLHELQAARCAAGHSRAGEYCAHQSRHAAHGNFAASHQMGKMFRTFALYRDR